LKVSTGLILGGLINKGISDLAPLVFCPGLRGVKRLAPSDIALKKLAWCLIINTGSVEANGRESNRQSNLTGHLATMAATELGFSALSVGDGSLFFMEQENFFDAVTAMVLRIRARKSVFQIAL